jgi:hypothetical protein
LLFSAMYAGGRGRTIQRCTQTSLAEFPGSGVETVMPPSIFLDWTVPGSSFRRQDGGTRSFEGLPGAYQGAANQLFIKAIADDHNSSFARAALPSPPDRCAPASCAGRFRTGQPDRKHPDRDRSQTSRDPSDVSHLTPSLCWEIIRNILLQANVPGDTLAPIR